MTHKQRKTRGVEMAIIMIMALAPFVIPSTAAQQNANQIFITWHASNFYPSYFEGKALPTAGSPVIVSVEATQNGSLLDLSREEIAWELDGKYIGGGKGVKQITFIARKGLGDTHFIHVSISRAGGTVETSLRIPVSEPTAIINAPYPERRGRNNILALRAVPFFFNLSSLSDLSFAWSVDGARQSVGNDSEFVISGSSNLAPRELSVALDVQNRTNPQEIARASAQFFIEP